MILNKRLFAFIGARSGSKGLVDKNIKMFHGKPLIAWTVEAALNSQYIDKVFVSTDSEKYAGIAQQYGAEVIDRPEYLSNDDSSLAEALQHAYEQIKALHGEFNIALNLQATSPLRTCKHIDEAIELYTSRDNEELRLFSCYQLEPKYAWIMKCNEQGYAHFVDNNEQIKTNHARQKNNSIYMPNGAIYILPTNDLSKFYNDTSIPYVMNQAESIDIDTIQDFELAEQLYLYP
ncbi:cytidylyltransferase domain-containing protein [Pseudocolwellia agarivorans]|uniref:acylneuraminate cytidylyltransferase family protein n=1 Tax=Pseudocolwellia agarivorans TaxID=1911682 RepID=UPI0009843FDA|nr:acylneuraminate cytidylyltransferase family protein [Pseudocolwellia agarivorans]